MYKIISTKTEKIDPEKAIELLKFNNFKSQRNLKEKQVRYLTKKILTDEFRTGEIAFAIMPNKIKYLMNGQHVLHATINSGKTINAFIEIFSCDDDVDLSQLFRQYDCNPIRSVGDMIRVEADALKLDWSYKTSRLLVGAIFVLSRQHRSTNRNKKVDMLKHHIPEGYFLDRLFNGTKENKILERIPVVTVIIETWKINPDEAFNFWSDIRDGEMLKKEMPQYKLRRFLNNIDLRGGNHHSNQYRDPSSKEIRYRCILAWNAFRRNKNTNLKYSPEKPIPTAI